MHGLHGAMHVDHHGLGQVAAATSSSFSAAAAASSPSPSSTAAPPNTTAAAASSSSPSPITALPQAAAAPSPSVAAAQAEIAASSSSSSSPIMVISSSQSSSNRKNRRNKKKMAKAIDFSFDQLSLDENEVSNFSSNNTKNTKMEYINNKIKLVIGSHYPIQSEHDINLFLEQLDYVLEKEHSITNKYKLIQDSRKIKNDDLLPESAIIGYPCEDPGPFCLSININKHYVNSVVIDTGSSINYMSKEFYDSLDLPILKSFPTKFRNQKVVGIIDDLPISVGDFVYPTKFLIFSSSHKNIILGRPFLNSSEAELSMKKGTIKLYAGGDHMRKIIMPWNIQDNYQPKEMNKTYLEDLEVLDRFVILEE